jgi:hypothetical protein
MMWQRPIYLYLTYARAFLFDPGLGTYSVPGYGGDMPPMRENSAPATSPSQVPGTSGAPSYTPSATPGSVASGSVALGIGMNAAGVARMFLQVLG